jgi:hypothetical protein
LTIEDAFDARLKAAFAAAEPAADEAFLARVTARLGGPNRRRVLIIGGAGAGGSTIASTQLEDLFSQFGGGAADAASSWLGSGSGMLGFVQPETLAAVTLAIMVAAFAFFLPSRS